MTQYNESERLLADPTVASGDMAIAEGLTFTNKAASSLHWASVKVGKSCRETCHVRWSCSRIRRAFDPYWLLTGQSWKAYEPASLL